MLRVCLAAVVLGTAEEGVWRKRGSQVKIEIREGTNVQEAPHRGPVLRAVNLENYEKCCDDPSDTNSTKQEEESAER